MKIKSFFKKYIPWYCIDEKIYKLYLKGHKNYLKKNNLIVDYYNYKIQKKYNCIISSRAFIEDKISFPHPIGIVIGKDVKVGKNVTIYQQVTLGQNNGKFPTIGDNVIIYSGAKIFGDIHIGNNVIIGANSVVNTDVPDNCIVAGVPARVIRKND